MKKKTIKSKLTLNKRIISKFNAAKIKGGGTGRCAGLGVEPGTTTATISIACTLTTCNITTD